MPNDFGGPADLDAEIPPWRRGLDTDYEPSDIYRETFLQWLGDGEDLATVRAYGQLQFDMTLSHGPGPVGDENWRVTALRSVAKDLRHLKNYLRQIAFLEDEQSDEEDEQWARYANRLAKKLGPIEEQIERALRMGPAAGMRTK
jgi:hypothetical protein